MKTQIPRGTVIGKVTGGPPLSEAEHFWRCEACGGYFDIFDLGAVLDHEEPLPIRWKIRYSRTCATHAAAYAAAFSEIQILLPHWQSNI
jgi:hypothetical protein